MKDAPPSGLEKLPSHEAAYRRLRDMVLFGDLTPGQKVTIHGVTETLGAGTTPAREAIRRLTAEGALILHENRRISVPVLTPSQVDELGFARLAIEPRLVQMAAANLTPQAIEALEQADARVDDSIARDDIGGYLAANYAFHFALYDLAHAPILLALTQGLWLRFGPSLRLVITSDAAIGPDRHQEALDALRAGDADAASAAMQADIAQGIERVRAAIEAAQFAGTTL